MGNVTKFILLETTPCNDNRCRRKWQSEANSLPNYLPVALSENCNHPQNQHNLSLEDDIDEEDRDLTVYLEQEIQTEIYSNSVPNEPGLESVYT